jgi:TPR repeat protein
MKYTQESLREQMKKGSTKAAFLLAEGWKWGSFGAFDPLQAARMYRICCRSKNKEMAAKGFLNLGKLYYYGHLSDVFEEEEAKKRAFECFMKSALLLPEKEALSRLGDMYRYGQYVEQNDKVALSLYLKAGASA